jgi:hypothetical protein
MFNLRRDPFERADENSNTYWDWVSRRDADCIGLIKDQIVLCVVSFGNQRRSLMHTLRRSGQRQL